MTSDSERCKALLARQQKLYLAMRRNKRHLFDNAPYTPTLTSKPVEKKWRKAA
jgi:hypothetical protein